MGCDSAPVYGCWSYRNLHSLSHTRAPLFFMLVCCRNQDVEAALQVANRAIREAGFWVPYLTIEALDAWTPLAITVEDLVGYAKRYTDGTNGYFETAQQRGVVVQIYDYKDFKSEGVKIAKHFVFMVFEVGGAVPPCDAAHRSRFYQLKRFVQRYWATDHYRLSSEVLKQPVDEHSNPPQYFPSLASEFLSVPDSVGQKPDRPTRTAVITAIGIVMSGYEAFLEFPEAATRGDSKQPRLSLAPSSSSSS